MKTHSPFLKWFIWALAAFFYFYEYALRVSPSVMVHELMQAFHVDATALGLLSAFYYYAYAPMQLPVGILIDRFGAKRLLSLASLICAAGILYFGVSTHIWEAAAGRFLMGFGSSIAFVAMVFVCTHWFEKSKRALLVGLANSIGMLGAMCGQGPLSLAVRDFNWRQTSLALGVIGVILAVFIYFSIGRKGKPSSSLELSSKGESLLNGLKHLCKSKQTWINAVITLLFYMTTACFGDLWGVPFLQTTYDMSRETASFANSMIYLGWLVGGPLMGYVSDFFRNRKKVIFVTIGLTLICLLSVIYLTNMPKELVYVCIFAIGFFSSGELLNFTLATEINPNKYKGSSIAFTNFVVSCGSSAIQPLFGVFLDLGWSGKIIDGVNIYTVQNYQKAFLVLPLMLVLAMVLMYFLKETPPKEDPLEQLTPH